jgi:hypothetical protein
MIIWFMFMLTITWSLSTDVGMIKIDDNENCRHIAGNFDHHVDAVVGCGVHHPMDHIQSFTRSHRPQDAAIGKVPTLITNPELGGIKLNE